MKNKVSPLIFTLTLFVFLTVPFLSLKAGALQWNFMSGDYETLLLMNETKQTKMVDPVSAEQGDQLRLVVYYHCGWTESSDPTEKARNTKVRINFPSTKESSITTAAQLWADNISAIDDTGTINLSSEENLILEDTAEWHHQGTEEILSVSVHDTYGEVDLGDVACDCDGCYGHAGYIVFRAEVPNTEPPVVDLEANGSDGPVTVDYGDDVELTWDVSHADDCDASGDWSGDKDEDGASEWRYDLTDDSYTYYLTCTGPGGLDSDSTTVYVEEGPTLNVHLQASPDHGDEPLENVDLEATVSGTAGGDIDYKFDCTNDGSWEYVYEGEDDESFTVQNACDYETFGTYTAKAKVYRNGLTDTDTDTIHISSIAGAVTFEVEKKTRNMSDGETIWKNSTNADPGEKIGFRVIISAPEEKDVENLNVEDDLSDLISWSGNFALNGQEQNIENLKEGFAISRIDQDQQVVLTYEILLERENEFGYGTTSVVNSILAYNEEVSITDSATIRVTRTGVAGATSVPTGALDNMLLSLGITILVTYVLLLIYFFLVRTGKNTELKLQKVAQGVKRDVSSFVLGLKPWYTRGFSEKKLETKIRNLKEKEK